MGGGYDGYRAGDDVMAAKDGGRKQQDWEEGALNRLFVRKDTPFEKKVRYVCLAGMLAVLAAYWYYTS